MSELPPPIQLLVNECNPATVKRETLSRKLSDEVFVRELRDQADPALRVYDYDGSKPAPADADLVIHGAGGLSPFSPYGKCSSVGCRELNALSFAQSIGLYSDYAVITDFVTPTLYYLNPKDPTQIRRLLGDLTALNVLQPLIREGIVRFATPHRKLCDVHGKAATTLAQRVAAEVWRGVTPHMEADFIEGKGSESLMVVGSDLFGGEVYWLPIYMSSHEALALKKRLGWRKRARLPQDKVRFVRPYVVPMLEREATAMLFEARDSGLERAMLATQSRLEAVTLRVVDRALIRTGAYKAWEELRECRLPWVSELTAEEVLRLREQARRALPAFRARMKRDLFSSPTTARARDARAEKIATELRSEVPEVEAELRASKVRTRKSVPVAVGAAGLACIVYGVGSLNPQMAAAGVAMMSALAAFHANHSAAQTEQERLMAKPAYVLLAARNLIRHREN